MKLTLPHLKIKKFLERDEKMNRTVKYERKKAEGGREREKC